MMIYLLVILLLSNLIFSILRFKYLIAPPVLVAGGMLAASIVAAFHFDSWEMQKMLPESVFILGASPWLFTIICLFFKSNKRPINRPQVETYPLNDKKFNMGKLTIFFLLCVLIGILECHLKVVAYRSFWGSYDLAELIFFAHMDNWSNTNDFQLPGYISVMSTIIKVASYFSALLLAYLLVYRIKQRFLIFLQLVFLVILLYDGMLGGTKGAMLDVLIRYSLVLVIIYYMKRGTYRLPLKLYLVVSFLTMLFLMSFQGLSLLIGRDAEDSDLSDMLSTYCGAQIKNFDIYMHGKDGNNRLQFQGEETFNRIYHDFHKDYEYEPRAFQKVRSVGLGNVYTQYYHFHRDFGIVGVVALSVLIAILSMYVYNNVLVAIKKHDLFNMNIFVYSLMSFTLFMSFFSSRFIDNVIEFKFLKLLIWLLLLRHFLFIYVFNRQNIIPKQI